MARPTWARGDLRMVVVVVAYVGMAASMARPSTVLYFSLALLIHRWSLLKLITNGDY